MGFGPAMNPMPMEEMQGVPPSVLILAGDTDDNIGDRAIVLSTCQALRRLVPGVRITLVSGTADVDADYFGATAIPRGPRGIVELVRATATSDLILCGGGGLFQDDASLVKMPYWALRLAAVRCVSSRICGFSLGVGPLSFASSRFAARLAFACMREITVRDPLARDLASTLTRKHVQVVPDPALMLSAASPTEPDKVLGDAGVAPNARPLVGVAVRRWFHHRATFIPHKYAVRYGLRPIPGEHQYQKMVGLLANVLDRLVEEDSAHVVFLPTYVVPHEADDETCRAVMHSMKTTRKSLVTLRDPMLYQAVAGRLDVMLAGRMHAAILAATMGTPIVGLSYNPKFEGFFRLVGLQDRLVRVDHFVEMEMVQPMLSLLRAALRAPAPTMETVESLTTTTRTFLAHALSSVGAAGPGELPT